MAKDNSWTIRLSDFYQGFSPASHLNTLTSLGNSGHATAMVSTDTLTPDYITQGPALANLTNGTQAGVVSELINYILDTPPVADTTYGIGPTKLFEISSTAVASGGTPSWPKTITDATAGKSIVYLKGVLYYFFNTATDSKIGSYDLATTFNDTWATGLVKASLITVAKKEDIMLFGHGRYVGTYFASTDTLTNTKLDFGNNTEVADICFHANQWFIAVNSGVSGATNSSQIYTYEGGATTALLSDEAAVGLQKIGFMFLKDGVIYVAYQDLTFTGGYKIGYLSGRKIEPLVHFKGSLPTYAQKTLYKNTILFLSSGLIYSAGAVIGELPFAISQLADGGYTTCGALAAPFGTPMVASTASTNFRLAKFSGITVTSSWNSIIMPIGSGRTLGMLDEIIVRTNILGENARCDLTISYNQAGSTSATQQITTTGKTRHLFKLSKDDLEDIRVNLNWANGSTTNACNIKSIDLNGHYISR